MPKARKDRFFLLGAFTHPGFEISELSLPILISPQLWAVSKFIL
jgi:hypothetical protein